MTEHVAPVPPDDPARALTVARPDQDEHLSHIGLVGDTYTILVAGSDTAGRYTLIDMHVPPGGGPPPHRHDFEEMFTVLDGEVEVTFRGETIVAHKGETINVPANAPHAFTNSTDTPSRLLCLCAPAGQEEFFTLVGQPVATRTQAPPPLSPDEQAAFITNPSLSRPSTGPSCCRPPAPTRKPSNDVLDESRSVCRARRGIENPTGRRRLPPVGDIDGRRAALNPVLDYFNNRVQAPPEGVEISNYHVACWSP